MGMVPNKEARSKPLEARRTCSQTSPAQVASTAQSEALAALQRMANQSEPVQRLQNIGICDQVPMQRLYEVELTGKFFQAADEPSIHKTGQLDPVQAKTAGCNCLACTSQLTNASRTLQLACDEGHEFHGDGPCPYGDAGPSGVIATGGLTTNPDHIKGNNRGFTRGRGGRPGRLRSQADPRAIARAQRIIEAGEARLVATTANDEIYEVQRTDPASAKAPRRFAVHRGGGDGVTRAIHEDDNPVRGADAAGYYSDTDDEGEFE